MPFDPAGTLVMRGQLQISTVIAFQLVPPKSETVPDPSA